MKKNLNKSLCIAMLAVLTGLLSFETSTAQGTGGGRLVGTWDTVVTIRNCTTGNADRSFASIASFNHGGTTVGSTSGMPQSSRTPEHGIWRHVSGNTYLFKFKSFSFDPAGNPISYGVVTHTIELDQSGDTYRSEGGVRIYNMNGVQIAEGCSDAVGTRFDF